ncbi:MAG: lytic transglycosylase domain-containing protein [bacterium]
MRRLLILPFLVGCFSLNFLIELPQSAQFELNEFEGSVSQIQKVMELDQERGLAHNKVNQIMDRFNPDMSSELKNDIADVIYEMSIKYPNLDVDLICATITHESGRVWEPKAVSNAGAMGLMQLMPKTARWLSKYEEITWTNSEEILFNPINNIRLGCRYLSALIETYDLEGGLAAYNGGERIARKWLANNKAEGILWDETTQYIPYILKLYDEFKSATM